MAAYLYQHWMGMTRSEIYNKKDVGILELIFDNFPLKYILECKDICVLIGISWNFMNIMVFY